MILGGDRVGEAERIFDAYDPRSDGRKFLIEVESRPGFRKILGRLELQNAARISDEIESLQRFNRRAPDRVLVCVNRWQGNCRICGDLGARRPTPQASRTDRGRVSWPIADGR